jgi:hypothetical protein
MPKGAPRTLSFAPAKMIEMGEEMIAFVKDPKNKVLHLSEWYTVHKRFTYAQYKNFTEREEFAPYHEQAIKIISKKYLDGTINNSIAQRFLRLYFSDLREMEDKKLAFEYSLKAQADIAALERYEPTMLAFLQQLKIRQDNFKTLDIKPSSDR